VTPGISSTGWLGGALSATGRKQAAELGARRRHDGIETVYSSDLARAVETAQIAFDGSGIAVRLDWRLRECDYGAYNGMPRAILAAERVDSFLHELRGGRVLLIGHVATQWALEHRVNSRPLEELAAGEFEWRPGWQYVL
jgi:broad specificity phosphatase PhoE